MTTQTTLSKDWHLVHDNSKVITCRSSAKGSKFQSIYTLFEGETYEECLSEIKRLNLIIDEKYFKKLKEDYISYSNKQIEPTNPLFAT